MSPKITISPITRINGHWKIDVEVRDGRVVDAWSSGIMFRGFENILLGRDFRDAVYLTERICGICSPVHALAAAFAAENAIGIKVPYNAVLIRNLILGAALLQNHTRHFYLMGLWDYVRGPEQAPFKPQYSGDFRLPKADEERFFNHYLESLDISRKNHEMVTIWGGKIPHTHGVVVGGSTVLPKADRIKIFLSFLDDTERFLEEKMIPDAERIAEVYEDYFEIGRGSGDLVAFGNFPTATGQKKRVLPEGLVTGGKIENFDWGQVLEHVKYSWYKEHPPSKPEGAGVVTDFGKEEAYSWVRAPRYGGKALETGPLAHLWVKGDYRRGISTMDRILARVYEAKIVAGLLRRFAGEMNPGMPIWTDYKVPDKETEGFGYHGAFRGALAHWLQMKKGRITGYQIVTPSAWNCSPRDDKGVRGPVEEALVGTPVADPENPVEIGRVVRAFDPCLACATHLLLPRGRVVEYIIP